MLQKAFGAFEAFETRTRRGGKAILAMDDSR
jgi:hypothetical protein